ncbi:MAG: PQQ-binding-like beta-propeller repeat protein, partial [Planctomycetes bacterium]|nr:PQQ-binding-like beta-propeller repeat protein [Planctomycetota bacterium]
MRASYLTAAVWFILSAAGQADGQTWPQFRGPGGDGIATTKHPETWSAGEHLAWKTKIPGVGWSQPIVWGDKVFVTTAAAEGQNRPQPGDWSPGDGLGGLSAFLGSFRRPPNAEYRWKVLCLSLADGKVLWEQDAHVGKPANPIHARNSYATETPVTDGERVIASFGPAGVYCFDASGKLLWGKQLGTYKIQMDWGTGSSPVLHEELVFLQCDNQQQSFLVALDKRTGDEVWRVARDEQSNWCTPYIWKNERRTELVTGGGGKMRSYDPATGKLHWEIAGSGRCAA